MANYIENYLKVLPTYQKEQVEKTIKDREEIISKEHIEEEEFVRIIETIRERQSVLSELGEVSEKMSSDEFNKFIEFVRADLNALYQEIILLESANTNFSKLYDAIISEIQTSLVELVFMSDNLIMEKESQNSTQIIKNKMKDYSSMESHEEHPALFVDRYGKPMRPISFSENLHNKYAALPTEEKSDALRFKDKLIAEIEIIDRAGIPIKESSSGAMRIEQSIDSSEETYFEEVFYLNEPMRIEMEK